jgi:FtsP/CotA-like multicopper oxidase with cupredoxin domain
MGRALAHPLVVVMVAVGALGSSTGMLAVRSGAERPASCIEPNRRMTLYAVQLPSAGKAIRLAYGLTPQTASIPGPTIEMVEGDCLAITVVNDVPAPTLAKLRDDPVLGSHSHELPLGVSLHVHGVKYTQASDGTLETGSWVRPGSARTYTWFAAPRASTAGRVTSQGTAGYWWYHDHIVGTSHGTGGAASGLFGAVIVRRPGDVRPDRTYVVGMGGNTTLNLRDFPDCRGEPSIAKASNTCYVALPGELVEFAVIAFGDDFHTFHLHGHNWADNRTGILTGPADETRLIDNRTIGPADTFGFVVRAGEEVGPGNWMLHCHVQTHADTGMMTFLHILGDAAEAPVHHHRT